MNITIATRESPLALWQAHFVKQRLEFFHSGIKVSILGITTQADKMLDIPLMAIGGKGLFVKELEAALLEKRADIAVHSMKDVPMDLPQSLRLLTMCERENPRDAFVSNHYAGLEDLPKDAILGTSSLRRKSQLQSKYPYLNIASIRGNVNTRLRYLDDGRFSALILAAAGLERLGLAQRISAILPIEYSLPAAGQGALGIETRENDENIQQLLLPLHHQDTFLCVTAERALCKKLGGNCQVPIAAYAEIQRGQIFLQGLVASPDGKKILRAKASAGFNNAEQLGLQVAEDLLVQGAQEILSAI